MKKRRLLAALLGLLLTACSSNAAPSAPPPEAAPPAEQAQPAEAEETVQTPEPSFTVDEVENNGGYFVRLNDRIYFRKYGPEALYDTAVFGSFLSPYGANRGPSELAYYDLTTREVTSVLAEDGYGPLYYDNGGFYLQQCMNDDFAVVWFALDGTATRTVGPGRIMGLSEKGTLAVEDYAPGEDGGQRFTLYRECEAVSEFMDPDRFYTYLGVTEDGLFLLSAEEPDGESQPWSLWQVSAADGPIRLGTIPDIVSMCSGEPAQFLAVPGKIGAVIGYYAGTGHFLNDLAVITAEPGKEASLTVLTPPESDREEALPRLSPEAGDAIGVTTDLPGDLMTSWQDENYGDLLRYDGTAWKTIRPGLTPRRENGSGFEKITQVTESVAGDVYVILADTHASPLDSIGWRDGYTLLSLEYLRIPASGGQEETITRVDYPGRLRGNVWLLKDGTALLWQQTDEDAYMDEATTAYLLPLSPEADWEDASIREYAAVIREDALAEPDYYGYPIPEAAPGPELVLQLDEEGRVISLAPLK